MMQSYNQSPSDADKAGSAAEAPDGMHRTVTTALIKRPEMAEQSTLMEAQVNAATTSAGVYDL